MMKGLIKFKQRHIFFGWIHIQIIGNSALQTEKEWEISHRQVC